MMPCKERLEAYLREHQVPFQLCSTWKSRHGFVNLLQLMSLCLIEW